MRPESSLDVSLVIKGVGLLNLLGIHTKLAVRGGGHDPNAGSANIEGGVTLDMRAMNKVSLDESNMMVSIGPGALWQDVYPLLDAKNLSAAGGRLSNVGVAGLTLGGLFLTMVRLWFLVFTNSCKGSIADVGQVVYRTIRRARVSFVTTSTISKLFWQMAR